MSIALIPQPPNSAVGPESAADAHAQRTQVRAAVRTALANPAVTRLVVESAGADGRPDVRLSQVIATLMADDRLDVEVAYVPDRPTPATRRYRLPHGDAARDLAAHGTAVAVPLIRDDAGTVLVGVARHLGADAEPLRGESYADNHRLFRGDARAVRIEPLPHPPGVRARLERTLWPGRWHIGRAVQTGGTNLVVERDGILTDRTVKRSTFYRHHLDLHLVCR